MNCRIEALERRLFLATVIGGRASPDPLDEAIRFRLPLSSDTTTHYYFDRDPAAGVDRAWNGSTTAVYDGHTGSDYSGGPRGRAVYAVADGVLTARVDGYADFEGSANGNYIKLNHGNDRNGNPITTFYLHLNAGTPINLPLGTFIAAGTQVGGVGTSGNSTGLHLHFHFSYDGVATDPYAASGETTWWVNQGSGSPVTITPSSKFQIGQYVEVFALVGDTLNIRSPNPNSGSIGTQSNGAIGQVLGGPALSYTNGDYNGNVYTRYKVQFTNGMVGWAAQNWLKLAPPQEITVAQGATSLTDGQAGAVSFGSVEKRQPGPTRVFTVTNAGNQTLTLASPSIPAGFTLLEGLPASLAPGAADTFTVRLDSTTVGGKAGQISFSNNDDNENPFNFPISGTVTADVTAPTADVVDVAPDPRNAPLGNMTIVFSEPVLGFDKSDLLFARNGGAIALTAAQTLTTTDNITFTLNNLGPLSAASGTYMLSVLAGGVTDDSSNALAAAASDSVKVQTSLFRGDATGVVADAYFLRRNGSNVEIFENVPPGPTPTYTLPWAGLTSLTFDTGGDSDALTIDYVNGDPVPAGSNALTYTASGAKSLILSGLGTFTLHQNMTLANLNLLAGARFDVTDNDVTITSGDVGSWNGSAYTGVTGWIQTADILTSTGAGIGVAPIAASVRVAATHPGDANADGVINGDDFYQIDAHAGLIGGAVSYASGDFDYNGRVDADDYFLIDSNYHKAQAVMAAPLASTFAAGAELPTSTAPATSQRRADLLELIV